MTKYQRPIVCLIVIRQGACGTEILLQRRAKRHDDTPYSGYLELPQGKINKFETLESAAKRELKEETGLDIVQYIVGKQESCISHAEGKSDIHVFSPLICVLDAMQNHLGLALVVKASGELRVTSEATGHRWYTLDGVLQHLADGRVFPLNVPMLKVYLESQAPKDQDR